MKISELIKKLQVAQAQHGDVVVRCLADDNQTSWEPVSNISPGRWGRDGSATCVYVQAEED